MLAKNFEFRQGNFKMNAPNGIVCWLETFYHASAFISKEVNDGLGLIKRSPERIRQAHAKDGQAGFYDLARELTNKFEDHNDGREWDGEFLEEVDNFLHAELPPSFASDGNKATEPKDIVLQVGAYFAPEKNQMIEFRSEVVLERTISSRVEPQGWATNRMHFFPEDHKYGTSIIWEIEYDEEAGMDDDEWTIGLEIVGKKVTGYDGVMSISSYAVKMLQLLGYNTSEIED